MSFRLDLDLGNDAFDPDPRPEIARLLRQAALRVEHSSATYGEGKLMDANGNSVGSWTFEVPE